MNAIKTKVYIVLANHKRGQESFADGRNLYV
jgi:predicted CopG family antitoxin